MHKLDDKDWDRIKRLGEQKQKAWENSHTKNMLDLLQLLARKEERNERR